MNGVPDSCDIGGSDGSAVRGLYNPHTLGGQAEIIIMTDEQYSRDADCYVPTELMVQTLHYLDQIDRDGSLLDQAVCNYDRFRKNIPYKVNSRFDHLEEVFRVFPMCASSQNFLDVFCIEWVHIDEGQESSEISFSCTFVSKIDRRVSFEIGRQFTEGNWMEEAIGISFDGLPVT